MRPHVILPIALVAGAIPVAAAFLLDHPSPQPACVGNETLAMAGSGEIKDAVKVAEATTILADEEDDEEQDEEDLEKEEEPTGWNRLWDAPKLG